ncbi:MAG: nucleotide exchange factor GrpE [Planctomycetota bacterium]|nr:nucleotide exchange factor GrpE [Planctomycetota bacterium]
MPFSRKNEPSAEDLEAVGHVESEAAAPAGREGDRADVGDAVRELEQQLGELQQKYQRALADYRNFQQRSSANERDARQFGAAGVLQSVITILDYFDMALNQDPSKATAEQILGGVRLIRDELMRAIGAHGVTTIVPQPGDEFDPRRHEAVQQSPSNDVAPGHVIQAVGPGYAMGDRVLRPARVNVAADPDLNREAPPDEESQED